MSDEKIPPRRGRPAGTVRVEEPHKSVATWLAASEHDRLIRVANQRGVSVSMLIRRALFPAER